MPTLAAAKPNHCPRSQRGARCARPSVAIRERTRRAMRVEFKHDRLQRKIDLRPVTREVEVLPDGLPLAPVGSAPRVKKRVPGTTAVASSSTDRQAWRFPAASPGWGRLEPSRD